MSGRPSVLRTLIFIATLVCGTAKASCGGGDQGKFAQGEIEIGAGDCGYAEIMIIVRRNGEDQPHVFPFKDECSNIFDQSTKNIGFWCRKNGKSPLAGARYRLRSFPNKNGVCGKPPLEYYACVQGCNSNTPKVFEDRSVECD